MRRVSLWVACVAFAGVLAGQTKTHLKVGDTAPDFELPSTSGKFKLSDHQGKKAVVLAFFSAAFTGG